MVGSSTRGETKIPATFAYLHEFKRGSPPPTSASDAANSCAILSTSNENEVMSNPVISSPSIIVLFNPFSIEVSSNPSTTGDADEIVKGFGSDDSAEAGVPLVEWMSLLLNHFRQRSSRSRRQTTRSHGHQAAGCCRKSLVSME